MLSDAVSTLRYRELIMKRGNRCHLRINHALEWTHPYKIHTIAAPQAAKLAEFALVTALNIDAKVNIARVMHIFQQLQRSPYKDNPDMIRLDYLLTTR